jgi:hypothetical protein
MVVTVWAVSLFRSLVTYSNWYAFGHRWDAIAERIDVHFAPIYNLSGVHAFPGLIVRRVEIVQPRKKKGVADMAPDTIAGRR